LAVGAAGGTADTRAGPIHGICVKEGPMLTCPRCGGDAEYLADDTDEVFSLLRCEFCGEDLDDADQVLRHAVDRMTQTPLVSYEQPPRPREAELA
jgi:hypothetical protein